MTSGFRLNLVALIAVLLSITASAPAGAHPHVWVSVHTRLMFDKTQAITGFRQIWTFDEAYTAFAIQGMDKNGDGKYDRAELEPLAKVNIDSLKEFEYFTFAWDDKHELARQDPRDYQLDLVNGQLVLSFTLPLAKPLAASHAGQFSFAVYDPTYFVAFSFAKKTPVELAGDAPQGCKIVIDPSPSQATKTTNLSESFFSSLDATSDWGRQFASRVHLGCGGRQPS